MQFLLSVLKNSDTPKGNIHIATAMFSKITLADIFSTPMTPLSRIKISKQYKQVAGIANLKYSSHLVKQSCMFGQKIASFKFSSQSGYIEMNKNDKS